MRVTAEVERLREELKRAETSAAILRDQSRGFHQEAERLRAELNETERLRCAANAEVERLKRELSAHAEGSKSLRDKLEQLRAQLATTERLHQAHCEADVRLSDKLAAANALLETSRRYFRTCAGCESHVAAIDAHFSSQPAAPPARPWSRRRDAPAPGVGFCTCTASPECPAHGGKT